MKKHMDFRVSQIAVMTGIANVLLSQLINIMSDEQPKPGEHKILLMLDEFTTLGKIEPLVAMMKVLAGNGVSVWTFVQSLTDVQAVYDHEGRNSILDNSEAIIFLGGESPDILDYLEKQLGKKIVKRRSLRTNAAATGPGQSIEERESLEPLMSRDELRMLPRTKALILPRGGLPILALRNYFFADSSFRQRAALRLQSGFVPDLALGPPPNVFRGQGIQEGGARSEPAEIALPRREEWRCVVVAPRSVETPGRAFKAKAEAIDKQTGLPRSQRTNSRSAELFSKSITCKGDRLQGGSCEQSGAAWSPVGGDSNTTAAEVIADDAYADAVGRPVSKAPRNSNSRSHALTRSARIRLARRAADPAAAIVEMVTDRSHEVAARATELGFDIDSSRELRALLGETPT